MKPASRVLVASQHTFEMRGQRLGKQFDQGLFVVYQKHGTLLGFAAGGRFRGIRHSLKAAASPPLGKSKARSFGSRPVLVCVRGK